MALLESESLIIRSYDLKEADRIVVFLSRDHGVVRGVAKGAKRLKSKFGSALEPFSVVRLSFFEKAAVELVSIQKAELIRSNFGAASDPDFLQKFSYLGDLLVSISPPHDPNETLYRMADACINAAVQDKGSLQAIGVYFEMWLLKLSGYLPDWGRCEICGRDLTDTAAASITASFQLMCRSCSRSPGGRSMDPSIRNIASAARRLSPAEFAAQFRGESDQLKDLSMLLKEMIARTIGRAEVSETSLAIAK